MSLRMGLGPIAALKVNEWMADPASGSDWFEIYNSSSAPVPLGGLFLTDNLSDKTQSPMRPLSFISGKGFLQFIADGNTAAGADHVNFNLKKSGEAVGVFSPAATLINGVTFGAQGTGVSQGRFPDGAAGIVSFAGTASPGESNYLPLTNAVVNEVLSHTDPPLEDAVEFYNPSGLAVNLGGWFLSNSKDDLKKFRIPDNTWIAPNGYHVFYQSQFGDAASPTAFTFNSAHGDEVHLSAADALGNLTGYRATAAFGAGENEVSFGRYQTSIGFDFPALAARTFGMDYAATVEQFRTGAGLPNATPKVGPIVINEVMYHPSNLGLENPDEEFIELVNVTGSTVLLYDPAYPTNTWKLSGAVNYSFPENTSLSAGAFLLVVDFDPAASPAEEAAFRSKYSVPGGVPLFGPWIGRLSNQGDGIHLSKPDAVQLPPHPDAGFVPYIRVDEVDYLPAAPWPASANGTSNSLQRIASGAYGNDPINWFSARPTAGRANAVEAFLDADGDGMDDNWEIAYFGSTARDGSGDFDGDGMSDLEEYRAGTNPRDPLSNLRLSPIQYSGGQFVATFNALPGRTYRIDFSDTLLAGSWVKLTDVPAQATPGQVQVSDSNPGPVTGTRFYRITTPAP